MNRITCNPGGGSWNNMKIAYLKTRVPADRYGLFLRGNLLVFTGYLIAAAETFIAIHLGLTVITYKQTFIISASVLSLTAALICITYFKKNMLVWQEWTIFGIYLITFLIAVSMWIHWLGNLRLLGILNALTAVTVVLSYTNVVQSLMMSISTLACYYFTTWYSIRISGQEGSFVRETFLSFCLLPAFILISAAAYYMKKRRYDLQRVKTELEVLNNELSEANRKLQREQMLTDIEMELASEIQGALFPKKCSDTDDWDVAFKTKPQGAVSGDFFDFYSKGNRLNGMSLFDVSGHGVAPALITILAKPVLYSHFNMNCNSELGGVLESVNSVLIDELEEVNIYITGLLLRMTGNEVEYVNAGHPDLLLLKNGDGSVKAVEGSQTFLKGRPLGISAVSESYHSVKFPVDSGDYLVFYSDGLTESRNFSGEQFGLKRLSEAVESSDRGSADSVLGSIFDAHRKFTGYTPPGDDITVIVARKC